MRVICVSFFCFLINCVSFSQIDPPPSCEVWSFNFTASNATIAIQQENLSNFFIYNSNGDGPISLLDVNCPMWIGVFYTNNDGDLVCGGYSNWTSSENFAITAWGDDPTTVEKDGFSANEEYILKLCIDTWGSFIGYPEMSSVGMFSDSYANNGLANIESVDFTSINDFGDGWQSIAFSCLPVELLENNQKKTIVNSVDIYGREISSTKNSGFVIQIFSDQTFSKTYRF